MRAKGGGQVRLQKSYLTGPGIRCPLISRRELTLSDRTLSAYINALAGAGFAVERLEEEPEEALLAGKANRPKEQGCCPSPLRSRPESFGRKPVFPESRGKAERISF